MSAAGFTLEEALALAREIDAAADLRSAALKYAADGFRVFPLPPNMKAANLLEWQNKATTDAVQISAWWSADPTPNIGLVGGNGLLILDIDFRKVGCREALAKLEKEHGSLPPTYTVSTPSGGEHRYFTGPDVPNRSGRIGSGLDIKSRGGYVVAPPSYTVEIPGKQSAGFYRVIERRPLAEAPSWFIALATTSRSAGTGTSAAAVETAAFRLRDIDAAALTDLKSALDYLATVSDIAGYALWSQVGLALLSLGDEGRNIWREWSERAPGYGGAETPEGWWDRQKPDCARTDYRHIFTIARDHGWINPRSRAAVMSTVPVGTPIVPLPPTPPITGDEWSEPVNFFAGSFEAPPFDGSEVPPELAAYPLLYGRQTGFDPSMGINAALTIAAAAIREDIQVCADSESNYLAQARLWQLTIAGPGVGKTPAQRDLSNPLWELHKELFEEWRSVVASLPKDTPKEEVPPQPRVIVTDVTLEKLSDVLEENPRGILLATDEFSAWLGSLDQYKSGGVSGRDRGEWLRLFDGGPHQIERVTRGSKFVPNWGASILTATTPSQLQKFASNLPEDGLIQRFLIAVARRRQPRRNKPPAGEVQHAREAYRRLVRRLWDMQPTSHGGVVQLAPDARERFNVWSDENDVLTAAFGEVEPAMAGHIAKYPTFALRIALTFHCVTVAVRTNSDDPAAFALSLNDLELAFAFLRRSAQHARVMYIDRAGASNAISLARDIARYILVRAGDGNLQRRELTQHVTAFRKADEGIQSTALRLVADFGWLRSVEDASTYRKPHPTRFEVSPAVGPKFAALAGEERKRRAVIVQRIAEHRA